MSRDAQSGSEKAFCYLCSELDLARENGLVRSLNDTDNEYQKYVFRQAKEKLNIDAIFFLKPALEGPSIPLVYFRKFESRNPHEIAELHKLVWNMGQAPLLFVVLPDVVLVYSTYEPPGIVDGKLDDEARFIEELNLFVGAYNEVKKLKKYHRSELVTGKFWQEHSSKFKKEKRVYRTLLDNLDFMRGRLVEKGLSVDIVQSLLIRSIFVKYLEDRKDNNGYSAFPEGFFGKFLGGATCFLDVLSDKNATYGLFRYLGKDKFNGDIFTIEKAEESKVCEHHLRLLQGLLRGKEYLESGQMMLWPLYSFDVIPIELISNIYQQFFHYEKEKKGKKKKGTYYTPYHLVAFLMDEVLPWDGTIVDKKILDPSCGSGVFLVEAYRRLIDHWMQAHPGKHPSFSDLKTILKENICGVDINREAIQIAALSLYLTMCDYLEPRSIWNEAKFEPLINSNLFASDFFEESKSSLSGKYDLIIGNSPWESELTVPARKYVGKRGKPVGDKQISQAFLWKVAEFCNPDGEICLIVSSKGLLFNRSTTNREFRKRFFSTFNVKTVINFSALRHNLFSEAVGPGAAVLFSPNKPDDRPIFYFSPKPCYSPQDDWLLLIEPQDMAHIPKHEAIENDVVWKVAMWGTPRDYELVKKLSKFPTLKLVCKKRNWKDGEGFQFKSGSGKTHEAPELVGKPTVDAGKLQRFIMDEKSLPINDAILFRRSTKKKRDIFRGPHLLIKQSPKVGIGLVSALLKKDAIFKHAILGIHGEETDLNRLASCCLVINSRIALYYEMLTSRSWLVERDSFEKEEIMGLPMPKNILDLNESYEFLESLSKNSEANTIVNELVMSWFDLAESEKILINDSIDFVLDYFWRKNKSISLKPINSDVLGDYIHTFCNVLNSSFSNPKKAFVGRIFAGESPLQMVAARLVNIAKREKTEIHQDHNLTEILADLDRTLLEEKSQSIYIRRNLRHYIGDTIFIVKPNQMRYWTKSSALRDADETYADIMTLWRSLDEVGKPSASTIYVGER
jgi:hypothetical protein